jgi:pimeloyl-ACP methyl ester carboxylesterase
MGKHGQPPYTIAVVHGGPGAAGEMAPVARELAADWGVLEPFQTATLLEGQVEELAALLEEEAGLPVTLVGHSWGAWLSYLVTARFPALVAKLILVGSGPFEARYAAQIQETRLSRLSEVARAEFGACARRLEDPAAEGRNAELARLGVLASRADAYELIPDAAGSIEYRSDIYARVWPEAAALRSSGQLLGLAAEIRCPVVAIHGDYDPHPADGVEVPLAAVLADFRMILLARCGHTPWLERWARQAFYRVLRDELRRDAPSKPRCT